MKTLILTLSLIAALNTTAQPLANIDNDTIVATNESIFDFNTDDYLPIEFDPYEGMFIDESTLLIEEPVEFNFDAKEYLPANFDPYKGMIKYEKVKEDEEAVFDFNVKEYLPTDFNPYRKNGTTLVAS